MRCLTYRKLRLRLERMLGALPHPLAGNCFRVPKSRLTRVIISENRSGVGGLLLVCPEVLTLGFAARWPSAERNRLFLYPYSALRAGLTSGRAYRARIFKDLK